MQLEENKKKEENNLLTLIIKILFARALITSIGHASSIYVSIEL